MTSSPLVVDLVECSPDDLQQLSAPNGVASDFWDSKGGAHFQEMGFAEAVDLEDVLDRCAVTAGYLIDGFAATYAVVDNLGLSCPSGCLYLSDCNNRGRWHSSIDR